MTTFEVPRTARPISETMFADLGIPLVTFTATPTGGQVVDCPSALDAAGILRGRIRLLTVDAAHEATLVSAVASMAANTTFAAIASPTTAQAVAQVKALTGQVQGLITWVGSDALGL